MEHRWALHCEAKDGPQYGSPDLEHGHTVSTLHTGTVDPFLLSVGSPHYVLPLWCPSVLPLMPVQGSAVGFPLWAVWVSIKCETHTGPNHHVCWEQKHSDNELRFAITHFYCIKCEEQQIISCLQQPSKSP